MNLKRLKSSDVLSLCAILISLFTLLALLYQTWLIQKQQYASVLPILDLHSAGPVKSEYKLILRNTGIGPAFIKSVKVHYKGIVYETDPEGFIKAVIMPQNKISFIYTDLIPGKVLPAGDHIVLLEVKDSEKDVIKIRQLFGNESAKLEVVYGSVYGEEWRMNGMDGLV